MNKPRGIIFDLGNTVLNEEWFDPLPGNIKLLEYATNPLNLTPHEIQILADEINRGLRKVRDEQMVEFNVQNFQRLLYETLGITLNIGYAEAEREFWQATTKYSPTEGIFEVLTFLEANNIKAGILSNWEFSGYLLEEELERHNLFRYFSFVISSADYGFRKPSPHIFNVAIKRMNLEPVDIWFVGDTLEYDIKGAFSSGLYPIWYNPHGKPNTLEYKCLEVRNWHEFLEKIQSL
ncbi:MAG TPA: HAD family hydrolase [Dehalococcoidales bacterium]